MMSREIYVPIADSFFESSIMREALPVRFVMLALIRLACRAGSNGIVDVDPLIFAQSINIPYDDVEAALRRLMEPDPTSGCPDEDGRRIMPVNPDRPLRGWRLVNWHKYQDIVHRANDAARKRDERAKERRGQDAPDKSENVPKRPPLSENGGNGATKTNTKTNTRRENMGRSAHFTPPTLDEIRAYASELGYSGFDAEGFRDHFETRDWVPKGYTQRMKSWKAAVRTWWKTQKLGKFGPAPKESEWDKEKARRVLEAKKAEEV